MQRALFKPSAASEERGRSPARLSRAKLFTALAIACALGVAVFLHLRSDAYSLARLAVSGNVVVSSDEVRALMPMGENLFWLDTGELAARLERHPFLAEVHLEKQYPDKLLV
ncbi:MAG TPA: FtsQ-type POTRA domain-containing protein, partial [Candidatus Coatesbacteria bacterium]|nr:FtsQ-type POTRA domain-containing protein [Candidatus Coatesbacteria bacterium]